MSPTPDAGHPVRLTRALEISTSLRYWRGDLSDQENQALFGRKARQHGHNYRIEVTLRGEPDPRTGMVIDLKDVRDILADEIEARFDHKDLNRDTPYFEKEPPTPENLARVIADLLRQALPAGMLDAVRLYEDPDTWVDVIEPPA